MASKISFVFLTAVIIINCGDGIQYQQQRQQHQGRLRHPPNVAPQHYQHNQRQPPTPTGQQHQLHRQQAVPSAPTLRQPVPQPLPESKADVKHLGATRINQGKPEDVMEEVSEIAANPRHEELLNHLQQDAMRSAAMEASEDGPRYLPDIVEAEGWRASSLFIILVVFIIVFLCAYYLILRSRRRSKGKVNYPHHMFASHQSRVDGHVPPVYKFNSTVSGMPPAVHMSLPCDPYQQGACRERNRSKSPLPKAKQTV